MIERSWVLINLIEIFGYNIMYMTREAAGTLDEESGARSGGKQSKVFLDSLWATRREMESHDVAGFMHTHPVKTKENLFMSEQDWQTMCSWDRAFGKKLFYIIGTFDLEDNEGEGDNENGLIGFSFEKHCSKPLYEIRRYFDRLIVIKEKEEDVRDIQYEQQLLSGELDSRGDK